MTTTTAQPTTVDLAPIFEVRERYIARGEMLVAGLAADDADAAAEARALLDAEEQAIRAICAQFSTHYDHAFPGNVSRGDDGVGDALFAMCATGDLCHELEMYDTRRELAALAEIREVIAEALRVRETRLAPFTADFVLEAFDRIVEAAAPAGTGEAEAEAVTE